MVLSVALKDVWAPPGQVRTHRRPVRLLACTAYALATAAVLAMLVWLPAVKDAREVELVSPGAAGPSSAAFHEDFPAAPLPTGVGHDGQQFYAVARALPDVSEASSLLDEPHYRLQRITFPVLARLLHPDGGGTGLVRAMILVNLLGVVLLGTAVGALSRTLGGPAWAAVVPGLLPGAVIGLLLGTPEALAAGLVLSSVVLSLRGHHRSAVLLGVVAVLTREVHLLVLLGLALWRRDRAAVPLVLVPAAAALVWGGVLRLAVQVPGVREGDFSVFGSGWSTAVEFWVEGEEPLGLLVVLLTALALMLATARLGWRTPLTAAACLQVLLLLPLQQDVVALGGNLARALLPLMSIAVVLLAVSCGTGRRQLPTPEPVH